VAGILGFPDPVNEVAGRVVAAGVVLLGLVTIVLDQPWLTVLIAYGFVARVVTGPTLSQHGEEIVAHPAACTVGVPTR
jgi:hypothetical protein